MDFKGIGLFLGLSYVVCGLIIWAGFRFGLLNLETETILHTFILVAVANLPALFAFLAGQLGRGPALAALTPVPKIAVVRVVVLVPVVFFLFNLVAAMLGHTILDWRLGTLMNVLGAQQQVTDPDALAVLPAFLIVPGFLIAMVLGATLIAGIVLGQVYAFHLFLMDRLAPLGRLRATLAGGVLWALWWVPLLVAYHRHMETLDREGGLLDALMQGACAVFIAVSLTSLVRQAYERSGSLALPAVVLGSFVAHAAGNPILRFMFQSENVPYTGTFGLFSAVLWLALGLFPGLLLGSGKEATLPAPVTAPAPGQA